MADAHCFVLRAEALYRMGERSAAVEDLLEAVHIAPDDIAANRRLLTWGTSRHKAAAAKVLIDRERDVRILRRAIAALRESGREAVASLRVYDDLVEGWAVWQGSGSIRVTMVDAANRIERFFDADPQHPLGSELGSAVAFRLPRLRTAQLISVVKDNDVIAAIRNAEDDTKQMVATAPGKDVSADSVTVIVPVYADHHATTACLESLLGQLDRSRHRVVVVNDASPDRRIHRMLDKLAGDANVRVLTNLHNLGFVGAVNRALGEVTYGDVVLLNSDTLVPPGAIARLASAARSSADIATVTPLSNNGEFTSFPAANRSNAIDALDVGEIDGIAARVNAGRIVDIPNGIGFCLYVTRACLNAVGLLSHSYCRGYLEDVDFCLRARQHRLRNVCATSVYVGHVGTRSFGAEKRSLVVRNLKIVEQRFPAYRSECADFILADPLRAARQAIETCIVAARRGGVLLVSAGGAVAEIARERAERLAAEGVRGVLTLETQHLPNGTVARLRSPNGTVPQSIDLMLQSETDELMLALRQLDLSRVELFDLARLPRALVEGLLGLPVAYDLFLAHAELGLGHTPFQRPPQSVSNASFWRDIVAGAKHVLVPDAQAEALAAALSRAGVSRLPQNGAEARRYPARVLRPAARIGLVAVRGCVREHALMREITIRLAREQPELDIAVIGTTNDEPALMRAGAFVTGAVSASELPQLFERYRLDRLMVCLTQPLFGHPALEASMATAIPVAYFDWSGGRCRPHKGDLALNPSSSTEAIAGCLVPWLGRRGLS
ncbi:MAG TPA: glycosyltransferase family 2 protein [Sphingomicrobium sp.]|nr:glycosyltransferase family 2 protein [Sphingomicrobium sp.]